MTTLPRSAALLLFAGLPLALPIQDADELAVVRAELTAAEARIATLEAELQASEARSEQLETELSIVQAQRFAEQQTFHDWLQFVATVQPEWVPKELPGGFELATTPAVEAQPVDVPLEPGLVRGEEMLVSLRNLLRTEGVFAYDLLTAGRYADGVVGPVVFRLLDDRGRLAGSLSAERLRLEAGRTGQTVKVVLEAGHERRGGLERAFETLDIPLAHVDPAPWVARLPELFRDEDLGAPLVEGEWNLVELRANLNALLAVDAAAGYVQLKSFDGVSESFLLGAHFVEHSSEGRVRRQLFADSVRLAFLDRGVVVTLFGAVEMRGMEKTPFPGGRHRVFLPNADQAAWRAAGLPGIPAAVGAGAPAPGR